jgi:hypothetical protein
VERQLKKAQEIQDRIASIPGLKILETQTAPGAAGPGPRGQPPPGPPGSPAGTAQERSVLDNPAGVARQIDEDLTPCIDRCLKTDTKQALAQCRLQAATLEAYNECQ